MLTAVLLIMLGQEPYNNPNNPNAPAYVKAEDAALQTTFAVEKFPKVLVAGRWADQGIAATDRCYIPAGITVTIDTTDAVCDSIRVDGVLRFSRTTDTRLFVTTIVGPLCGSTLDAGTQADPITAKCEVVFRAKAVDINEDPREFGTGYVGHRTLVWGVEKQSQADFVNAVVGAGSVSFTAAPKGWQAGDTIVLAGTEGFGSFEKRELTAVNGVTVSFAEPLKYKHGAAFAINLTRNITFRSENAGYGNTEKAKWPSSESYSPPVDPIVKQRGHFMVMGCGVGNSEIGYAAFNDLGRTDKRTHLDAVKFTNGKRVEVLNGRPSGTNQVGRYALHFHHGGRLGTPAIVRGCAVNGSPGWGFTNHSSNVTFLESVAFDFIGAGFACEIGDEVGSIDTCAAIGGRGGFANRDGVVNSPLFDREQGTNGAGFWSQTAGRVKYRNLRAANCVSGFNYWAGPGTQVYSNLPNRVDGNVMGAIDPADIDPAGPDAYLLKFVDPATGTINPIRSRLDFDGGSFVSGSEGDFMLGPATSSPATPHLIRNLKAGAVNAQYTLYTQVEDTKLELPVQQPPYIVALQFSGTDNSAISVKRSTLTNWGKGVTVPMGLSEVSDCTLKCALNIYVPQATLVNISSHPQRPRELYVERNQFTGTLLGWAGINMGQNPVIQDRIVVDGKQLYGPQSEPDFVPFVAPNPEYTPLEFAGKTNRQLLDQYGQCVNGDVTPPDAVLDARFGFKTGTPSKRLAYVCRPDGYQNTQIRRPSGTIAKLPVEFYPLRQHEPVVVNVDHPVAPGWQTVLVDYQGEKYGINIFGTGSTPPPEPPTPPPLVVTTVEVTPANLTLEVGKTAQLTAVVKDQFGAVMPGKVVQWSSSDGKVATVQSSGAVAAIASGNAVITATADGKQGAANVTVTSPPQPAKTIKRVTIEYSDGTTEVKP